MWSYQDSAGWCLPSQSMAILFIVWYRRELALVVVQLNIKRAKQKQTHKGQISTCYDLFMVISRTGNLNKNVNQTKSNWIKYHCRDIVDIPALKQSNFLVQQLSLVPGNIQIKTRVEVFAWIVLRVTHLIVGREWGNTRSCSVVNRNQTN